MKTKLLTIVATSVLMTLLLSNHASAQEPSSDKPRQIAVNVLGEVNRPGRYLLPERTTVLDALAVAGGEKSEADLKHARLIHATTGDHPTADKVDMRAVCEGTKPAPVLREGDSLQLPRKLIMIQY